MTTTALSRTTTGGDTDIAAVGALVADPARCRMLLALGDGRALPASRLAAEAGVSAATASSHLGKLTDAGFLEVEAHGRFRYYRLAGPDIGRLLETLQQLAPVAPVRSLRQGTRAHQLRNARTCYDHVAGKLGVALMQTMLERGHITGGDGRYDPSCASHDRRVGYGQDVDYVLSPTGQAFFDDFAVRIPSHRQVVRYCVDWSEQRHHLSGALGRGLLDRLTELGWILRAEAHRALLVTATGEAGLARTFGIDDPGTANGAGTVSAPAPLRSGSATS